MLLEDKPAESSESKHQLSRQKPDVTTLQVPPQGMDELVEPLWTKQVSQMEHGITNVFEFCSDTPLVAINPSKEEIFPEKHMSSEITVKETQACYLYSFHKHDVPEGTTRGNASLTIHTVTGQLIPYKDN